jgi:hypothetical protein
MKERFKTINFKGSSLFLIQRAIEIITELDAMGYKLTLRQLYYQMVARDIIQNKLTEYKRLGSIINDARLAGVIDWDAIEDRTRYLRSVPHWRTPDEIIRGAADAYRIDKWADQDYRIEVWVEKDALIGIVEKACWPLDVKWFSCRGYGSQTALYDAGKRLERHLMERKHPVVIHLGDHDPSGLDMTRDIQERLEMFAGGRITLHRVALNMDQIDEYHPPENPAKESDSRYQKYTEEYETESSWELDALNPQVIETIIHNKVMEYRDEDRWEVLFEQEKAQRRALANASNRWTEVQRFLTEPTTSIKSKKTKP